MLVPVDQPQQVGGAEEPMELALGQAIQASEDEVGQRAEIAPSASLAVRVTRKKFPVPKQLVTIRPSGASEADAGGSEEATTDRSGFVRFQLPPDGQYEIEVARADGADPASRTVALGEAGSKLSVRMELHSDVPAARVSGREVPTRRGADRRCARGGSPCFEHVERARREDRCDGRAWACVLAVGEGLSLRGVGARA